MGRGPNPRQSGQRASPMTRGWLLSVQKDASHLKTIHNRAVSLAGFS